MLSGGGAEGVNSGLLGLNVVELPFFGFAGSSVGLDTNGGATSIFL